MWGHARLARGRTWGLWLIWHAPTDGAPWPSSRDPGTWGRVCPSVPFFAWPSDRPCLDVSTGFPAGRRTRPACGERAQAVASAGPRLGTCKRARVSPLPAPSQHWLPPPPRGVWQGGVSGGRRGCAASGFLVGRLAASPEWDRASISRVPLRYRPRAPAAKTAPLPSAFCPVPL